MEVQYLTLTSVTVKMVDSVIALQSGKKDPIPSF